MWGSYGYKLNAVLFNKTLAYKTFLPIMRPHWDGRAQRIARHELLS